MKATAEERSQCALAEARRQIESGLIQGCVMATNADGIIGAVGNQCVHPAPVPMSAASRFDIASCGKTFTAACVALLSLEGKIDLDAPFTEYLPEHCLGKSCPITVRDLAMHVSGFDNSKPYSSSDPEAFLKGIYDKRPVWPRQTHYEYACSNFIMLGFIAEHVTGKPLEAIARERIWQPLAMTHTCWSEPGSGPHEVEHWFPNRPAGVHNDEECRKAGQPIGSGSCFSTAGDLLLFVQDIITQDCFPQSYYDLITTCRFDRESVRRAFCWDMTAGRRPRNLSEQAIFHTGWTGQTLLADPGTGFAAVVLTSRTGDWTEACEGRARIIEKLYGGTMADDDHLGARDNNHLPMF